VFALQATALYVRKTFLDIDTFKHVLNQPAASEKKTPACRDSSSLQVSNRNRVVVFCEKNKRISFSIQYAPSGTE